MTDFQAGDKLWFVSQRAHLKDQYVTIKAVGRKWLTLDIGRPVYRADKETLVVDCPGYASPGKCYIPQDDRVSTAWTELIAAINRCYTRPDGVTVEDIENARKLLKI